MANDFYSEIAKLKTLERTAWIMGGIQGRRESDAEHTFSMLLTALEIFSKNDLQLDQLKVFKMIGWHEVGEIDAGDITPFSGISKEEKYKQELACVTRLSKEYKIPQMLELWLEFEERKTPEAKFVYQLDKYDAIKQAGIYSKELFDEFRRNYSDEYEYMEELLKDND